MAWRGGRPRGMWIAPVATVRTHYERESLGVSIVRSGLEPARANVRKHAMTRGPGPVDYMDVAEQIEWTETWLALAEAGAALELVSTEKGKSTLCAA